MKRKLAAILMIMLMMCACGGQKTETKSENPKAAPPDYGTVAGIYRSELEGVSQEYFPELTLGEDGSMQFRINLLSNMGLIEGSYVYDGETKIVAASVDSVDFEGFACDGVESFSFDLATEDSLMFRGAQPDEPLGMTAEMDLFKKVQP